MNRFLVVGSGAAAVGTIYGLIDKYGESISIDILTSEYFSGEISGTIPSKGLFMPKKTKKGKSIRNWECADDKLNIYDSRPHSMTQFWGAGMMTAKLSEGEKLVQDYGTATKKLLLRIPVLGDDDYVQEYLGHKSHNLKWSNDSEFPVFNLESSGMKFCSGRARISIISSPEKSCTECGKCMSGCPEDVIWHSLMDIEKISKIVDLNVINGEVVKIFPDNLQMSAESQMLEVSYDSYKSVFWCTGVASTIKVVLNSLEEVSKIDFFDTPVYTIPLIIYGKKYSQKIALSNDMVLIEGVAGSQLASVYPFVEDIWETQFFKLFKKIAIVRKLLERHLCFIRVYSNRTNPLRVSAKIDDDGNFILSRDDWEICGNDQGLLSNLKRVLRSKKVYSLPLKVTNLNSAHYYGGSNTAVGDLTVAQILKEKFPRIQITDAFMMHSLPSISTTFTIMVNAYCKAQEFNKND